MYSETHSKLYKTVISVLIFLFSIAALVMLLRSIFVTPIPENKKISRIVHLSWKSRQVPKDTVKWIERWSEVNPDWQIWFWDDRAMGEFVRRQFPQLVPVYDRYPAPIYRSDMVRYLWLHKYGGVWSDLDIEPLKSLEPIRDQYSCVLSREHVVHTRKWNVEKMACNAYMMCRQGHPLFSLIIDMLETNQKYDYPITATGPLMLTRMYEAYDRMTASMSQLAEEDVVHLADVELFMPRADIKAIDKLRKVCEDGSIRPHYRYLCKEIETVRDIAVPSPKTFVDHHWWHSWLSKRTALETVSIEHILPNVIFPEPGVDF